MNNGLKCKSIRLANRSLSPSLKSSASQTDCNIRFENRTLRRADLLWFDYGGVPVRYCTMPPGSGVNMVTFVGHPWVCRDSETGDELLVNHGNVFKATSGATSGHRMTVMITIPVYTLHKRCLQVISKILPRDGVKALELPETLKDDLLERYDS